MIEMYIGIICACLPILKVFCKHHFPSVFAGEDEFEGPAFSTGLPPSSGNARGLSEMTMSITNVGDEERGVVGFGREEKEEEKEEGSASTTEVSASWSASANASASQSGSTSASASEVFVHRLEEAPVSVG
jgi:hypothetical protein